MENRKQTALSTFVPNINSVKNLFSPYFSKEKDYFIDNLGILLSSGLDIKTIFASMRDEFKSQGMKEVLEYLILQIDNGNELWKSLDKLNFVPDYVISLIRIGEETGRLKENFKVIAEQRKKEVELKSKIQSAAAYPIFVLAVSLIIMIGITWFILPSLSGVFNGIGADLPAITKFLISVGEFMSEYGIIFVPCLFLFLGLSIYFVFFYKKTKFIGQSLLFNLPFFSNYLREIELSRFGFYLGTLLKSGVPINNALNSLSEITTFTPYKNLYLFLQAKIIDGYSFEESFKLHPKINKLIPRVTQNMVISGERSGNLDVTFSSIGNIFENKTESSTKNLTVLLEPALLIIVWFAVGGIAIGIILPIYSLIGNINTSTQEQSNSTNIPQATPTIISTLPPITTTTPSPTITIMDTPTATPIPLKQIQINPTSIGYVNIREQPNTRSKVLRQARTGEKYIYSNLQNDWYQVLLDGQTIGWINKLNVQEISN